MDEKNPLRCEHAFCNTVPRWALQGEAPKAMVGYRLRPQRQSEPNQKLKSIIRHLRKPLDPDLCKLTANWVTCYNALPQWHHGQRNSIVSHVFVHYIVGVYMRYRLTRFTRRSVNSQSQSSCSKPCRILHDSGQNTLHLETCCFDTLRHAENHRRISPNIHCNTLYDNVCLTMSPCHHIMMYCMGFRYIIVGLIPS